MFIFFDLLIAFNLLPYQFKGTDPSPEIGNATVRNSIGAEMKYHIACQDWSCVTYEQKLSTTCPSKSHLPRNSITLRKISSSVPVVSKGISISTQPWEDKKTNFSSCWGAMGPLNSSKHSAASYPVCLISSSFRVENR